MDINQFQYFIQLLNQVCSELKYNGSVLDNKILSMGLNYSNGTISESEFISWIQKNVDTDYKSAENLSGRIINQYPQIWFNSCYNPNTNAANQVSSVYKRISDLVIDFPMMIDKINENPEAENKFRNMNNIINGNFSSFMEETSGDGFQNIIENINVIPEKAGSGDIEGIIKAVADAKIAADYSVIESASEMSLFMKIKWLLKHTSFYDTMNSSKDLFIEYIKTRKISVEFDTPYTIYLPTGVVATYKVSVEGGSGSSIENETALSVANNQLDEVNQKVSFSLDSIKAGIGTDGNISIESSSELNEKTSISTELAYDTSANSIALSIAVETKINDGTTVKTLIELEKDLDSNWSYEWEPIPVEEYEKVYVDRNVTNEIQIICKDLPAEGATLLAEAMPIAILIYAAPSLVVAGGAETIKEIIIESLLQGALSF